MYLDPKLLGAKGIIEMIRINKKKIEYSDYFVAFLDVLGFKKLVLSEKQSDMHKIESYFGLIEHVTKRLSEIKAKQNLESIIISDSVILSMPVGDNLQNRINNLRNLCVAVGIIQYNLAVKENIWLRGAISSGKAYFNSQESAIVGPAYIYAYLLEKEAIYPRVIVDNNIIKFLNKSSAQDLINDINKKDEGGLNYSNWKDKIIFDWENVSKSETYLRQDTALFIDYLSQFLDPHKDDLRTIIAYIGRNIYSDINVYSKFRWIADYLLVTCERLIRQKNRYDLQQYFNELKKY